MTLNNLINLGFDLSTHDEEEGILRPRCSQCDALCIQGVPCHEKGCPNAKRQHDDDDDNTDFEPNNEPNNGDDYKTFEDNCAYEDGN